MLKQLLVIFPLVIPVCCHGQSYADSPFYQPISAIPSSAHVEGYAHGDIKANGVVIDLSEWLSAPLSPEFDQVRGWNVAAHVDQDGAARVFHFYIQYNNLNITFGYNLLVQPEGTDKIKCTFSALTDPPPMYWHRDKDVPVVALPDGLTPMVIKSGDAIAIKTFPLDNRKLSLVHYLRLSRTDQHSQAKRTPVPTIRRVRIHFMSVRALQ